MNDFYDLSNNSLGNGYKFRSRGLTINAKTGEPSAVFLTEKERQGWFLNQYIEYSNGNEKKHRKLTSFSKYSLAIISLFLGGAINDYFSRSKINDLNITTEKSIADIVGGNFDIDGKNCNISIKTPSELTNQIGAIKCGTSGDGKIIDTSYTIPNAYLSNPIEEFFIPYTKGDIKIKEEIKDKNQQYKINIGQTIQNFSENIGEKLQCNEGYNVSYKKDRTEGTKVLNFIVQQVPSIADEADYIEVKCN